MNPILRCGEVRPMINKIVNLMTVPLIQENTNVTEEVAAMRIQMAAGTIVTTRRMRVTATVAVPIEFAAGEGMRGGK